MRYLIILSAISLVGCAPQRESIDPRTISGVDPVFVPYLETYMSYKGMGVTFDIPIQFTDLDGSTAGLCTRWSTGHRQIEIDKGYWDMMSEGQRIGVIAHELGHCDLDRDHNSDKVGGQPVSIMYPYVFSLNPTNIVRLMTELFHPSTKTTFASKSNCVKDVEVESTTVK